MPTRKISRTNLNLFRRSTVDSMARFASKLAEVYSNLLRFVFPGIMLGTFAGWAIGAESPMRAVNKNPESAPPADNFNPDSLKPYQTISLGPPPLSPTVFDPDPGIILPEQTLFTDEELSVQLRV